MSAEIQLAFLCPHLIGEERVALSDDRMTLYTNKPISGLGSIVVTANDKYVVSSSVGVQSRARLKSSRKEPYLITPSTRTLVLRSADQRATLTLPTGYLSSERVVGLVNAAVGVLSGTATLVAKTENGYLVFEETAELGIFSKVLVEGTAQIPLGFEYQNGSTGKVVLPTWSLFSRSLIDTSGGASASGYFIRFNSPVRGTYYFSVSYPVAPNQCLRCLTTEVENDYRFDAYNNPLMVDGNNLLYQSCLKIILTELRSNIYYPWYGTNLISSIGTKALSGTTVAVQQAVRTALTNFQNLQAAQANFQRVTAAERLYSIDRVVCTPSPVDPTVYLVEVAVRSYSNDPVNITIVYTAPGTFALSGTNGLSLGNFGQ